jgi:hypothetical protein
MKTRLRSFGRALTVRLRRASATAHRPLTWWSALEPAERILYRAAALSAIGFGMVALPLAFIVPAVLFALVFFGFTFRRVP